MSWEETEEMDVLDLQDWSPLPLLKLDPERIGEGPSLEVSNTEFETRSTTIPTFALKPTDSSLDLCSTANWTTSLLMT